MKTDLEILLDTVEDLLKYGEHEGPCVFESSHACKLHIENVLRREAAVKESLKLFREGYLIGVCNPDETVL